MISTQRRAGGAMRRRSLTVCLIMTLLGVALAGYYGGNLIGTDLYAGADYSCDRVLPVSNIAAPVIQAQFNEPPASPCTVVSYAACNYLIPSNDSVTFSLATPISFTNCPVEQVSTATITFQGTPNIPIFVWLSNATASTTPVYMTGATQTITKAWFGSGTTSWFGGGPWTTLNVQAIYPSPPPTTYFYPISCTIVYQ